MTHPIFDLIENLRQSGVQFSIQDSHVHIEAPLGSITEPNRRGLSENKNLVIGHLKGRWIVTGDNQWVTDCGNFSESLTAYEQTVLEAVQSTSRPHCIVLWKPTGHWARIANIPEWTNHNQKASKEGTHV